MSELQNARSMLEAAEHAAMAGDLASADELLRGAARIQEAELGPLHPELANTLNNRAIVAEKTGRLGDAETFYRRAAAIASASLPADDPMVVASRQNLEDFCHARDLPVDAPTVMNLPAHETELGLDAFAREDANGVPVPTGDVPSADEVPAAGAMALAQDDLPLSPPSQPAAREAAPTQRASRRPAPHQPVSHQPASRQPAPPVVAPPTVSSGASRTPVWIAAGVIALLAIVLLVMRPWSSSDTATSSPSPAQATAPPAPARVAPPVDSTAAREQTPAVAAPTGDRPASLDPPAAAPAPASSDGPLAAVQLCRTLSTGGGAWRCDAVTDPVAPGPLVFYTRIRSSRDGVVVHQWYQGDTLRKSVKLAIKANAREGYRTYSRQTVDAASDWRVEVRSADGAVLHEQRFAVQ